MSRLTLHESKTDPELLQRLVEAARRPLTKEEIDAQTESYVRGESILSAYEEGGEEAGKAMEAFIADVEAKCAAAGNRYIDYLRYGTAAFLKTA